MTSAQKVIKYFAFALAISLTVSIIGGFLSLVGVFFGFFDGDSTVGDLKAYSVSGEIHSLEIEFGAAVFKIEEIDGFLVESNLKKLKVDEKNGRLIIKDESKNKVSASNSYENKILTLYVPKGFVFDSVDLEAGAGRVRINSLSAERIALEFGAGEVIIDNLVATKSADIDGGAGRFVISGGALKNLDIDSGVGELDLTSALSGECHLDMGVGESNISLIGDKSDYKLELEKGIGNITVDGENVFDFGSSGNSFNKIEVSGGIGKINIRFVDAE